MAYCSMRKAYHSWQVLNRRLEAAREKLNHEYLVLLHKAEEYRIAPQRGILGAAASLLEHSPDPVLQLQEHLHHAFAILGKGFFRRSPTSLQLDIFRLADQIQAICQQCNYLVAKLQIAQKVFDLVQHYESISKQYLHLALINPEGVWVSLLLHQRGRLTRQATDLCLSHSWRTKQALCQRFCRLLKPFLPPENFRDLRKCLIELEDLTVGHAPSNPWSVAANRRLDNCIELAHTLASEIMASQSEGK